MLSETLLSRLTDSQRRAVLNLDGPMLVVAGPGSGKTFLARKLSEQYRIPHYDLDDIQWDNFSEGYGTKRGSQERDSLLADILEKNDWIIEGIYYSWCTQCFEDADRIILLEVPRYKYRFRIIRRYVRRKLHPFRAGARK